MKKGYLALAAMCALLSVGCSKKEATAGGGSGGATGPKEDASKTLIFWEFSDEIGHLLDKYYKPDHPDIEIVRTFTPSDQFSSKLDPVLSSGNGAPDVFALENGFVRKYVESELLLPLDDIYAEVKDKMVAYPMQIGTYNGHVYGMSWQITPGAVFYRRSIAKEYFGTDDPDEIQKQMSNIDKFVDMARTLKEKSGGSCVMVPSSGELIRPYMSMRKKPWIVDDKLFIDPAVEQYMEMTKLFHDEELDGRVGGWSEGWFAGMKDSLINDRGKPIKVFCYFLPTWGLYNVLVRNGGDVTSGDWAMCAGPSPYRAGGTWLAAYKDTKNPNAAKEMIRYLCTDDAYLEKLVKDQGEVVGNINVQNKVKDSYSEPFLAGQNHYKAFCDMVKNVDESMTQATDGAIESIFTEAVNSYSLGEKSKEQALADFKEQVSSSLGY